MKYIRPPFEEDAVAQFHEIITILEEASGEDLSHFKIPPDQMKPRVVSAQRASYGGRPGTVRYADKKHCDAGYFRSQLEALGNYARLIRGGMPVKNETNPYESLTDDELKGLLLDRRIKPKRVIANGRDEYVYDRTYAIGVLLKHDRPENSAPPTTVINVHGSQFIHGSPGASITGNVGIQPEDVRKILADLKTISSSGQLSEENREQINVDIGTVELQINSSRPNPSIIKASLESAKAILEHAGGIMLGTAAIAAIKHYLHIPQ